MLTLYVMNHKTCTIDGRECFISDAVHPYYILIQTLGDRAIARVGDSVRSEYELLKAQLGSESCTLVWNPGNHFQDGDKRLAAAFSWCIKELEGK